jgi:hypothetical protein
MIARRGDPACPWANWRCFAQLSPMTGGSLKAAGLGDGLLGPEGGKLALFCTSDFTPQPSNCFPIGFVFPTPIACPIHHNSFSTGHLPLLPAWGKLGLFVPHALRRELALFGAVVPVQGGSVKAFGLADGLPRPWGDKLALFCQRCWHVPFTITLFPHGAYPSRPPAENWVCLARLSLWRLARRVHFRAPPPNWLCLYIASPTMQAPRSP